jgi:Ca2+-binding EF-hand superfamily protein
MKISQIHFPVAAAIALTCSAIPVAAQPFGGGSRDLAEQLKAADRDHDGQVSRAELVSHRTTQWSRFDRNGDGYFSRDDLPGFVQDRWNGEKLVQLRRAYDRNGDDRISRAEFVGGPTPAFDVADANGDGLVGEAEMRTLATQVRD